MQSLILVIEHRRCRCGMQYTAPNPRPLTRHELANLRYTKAKILLPGDTPPTPSRETLHIDIAIEACPRCFFTSNGVQFELFPRAPIPTLIFVDGKVEERESPRTKANPFGLAYF